MIIALHIPSWIEYELTWSVYLRKEDGTLWIAVSYIDWQETKTNEFPVNEETWEILHPDFELR